MNKGRTILALLLGVPAAVFFLLSVAFPVLGKTGDIFDPILSATCHRLTERCIQMPWGTTGLCARCTAFWFGLAVGISFMYPGIIRIPFWTGVLFLIPLIIDGVVQSVTPYESTNVLRVLTGLTAGTGISILIFGKMMKD
ncbi:MAG: DUF2085 domain-containing protein [Candidatus Fermentibacteraceae bacterium]|nr:DUF2085 domain-containing protein [Candidatus Fermentibacteraceae bacterium]